MPSAANVARLSRNSWSRSVLTLQWGGSWTRIGPRNSFSRRATWRNLLIVERGIFQALHVGAVAAEFQHIAKFRRSLLVPGIKRFRGRQPIKGVVDLDRIEILRVVSEPMLLGQILWVKPFFPMIVLISRSADAKLSSYGYHGMMNGEFTGASFQSSVQPKPGRSNRVSTAIFFQLLSEPDAVNFENHMVSRCCKEIRRDVPVHQPADDSSLTSS